MYWVYRVEVGGKTRYIGMTRDIYTRETQHNYLCFKRGKKKALYDGVRKQGEKTIKLLPMKTFRTKVEAKRWECFLILNDYFNKKELWQSVPKITDM